MPRKQVTSNGPLIVCSLSDVQLPLLQTLRNSKLIILIIFSKKKQKSQNVESKGIYTAYLIAFWSVKFKNRVLINKGKTVSFIVNSLKAI